MQEQRRQIIAAHYFYLLKEDDESMGKLWSQLSGISRSADTVDTVSSGGLPSLSLDAAPESEHLSVMHCLPGKDRDLCLAMMRNLAVIEVIGLNSGQSDQQQWIDFMRFMDGQRRQAITEGIALFGETAMLVAPLAEERKSGDEACDLIMDRITPSTSLELPGLGEPQQAAPACRHLVSHLAPELCGGGMPTLTRFPGPDGSAVDYYVLRAADPEAMVSSIFPELDSQIKELARATAYFREQRDSIVAENTNVDKQVGALLHRQVVSMEADDPDTTELESRISDLSRMFGILATDSLMVRQAEKRLEKDLGALRRVLGRVMEHNSRDKDGIGGYYIEQYSTELAAIRTVSRDLDHSRQSAEAAIDVIRTQIELLRAEEESEIQTQTRGLLDQILKLQEEGLALQVAAGLIEFVLIFYYVLLSWEHVLGVAEAEHISPLMKILPVFGIAAGAAFGTHYLARSIKNKTWRNPGLWVSGIMLILALIGLLIISFSL